MLEVLKAATDIGISFLTNIAHNWIYLVAGVIIAAAVKVYAPTDKLTRLFQGAPLFSIALATLAGALTPLCSCGTVAVILGLVASGVPWPPIVAFLVSSPLMSPSTYVLMVGSLGVTFANAELLASIGMAFAAGLISIWIEKTWVIAPAQSAATSIDDGCGCSCGEECQAETATDEPCESSGESPMRRFGREILTQGAFILKWFLLFDLVGSALGVLVPTALIQSVFGQDRFYSVPLAALIGVPLYVSDSAAIPLMGSLVKAGMSKGAALAFMISGPGTSFGAMAAVLAVAPKRVLRLYVGTVLSGAIAFGYAYNWLAR